MPAVLTEGPGGHTQGNPSRVTYRAGMDALLLALITIALGLIVTFAGYTVLRVAIAIVGGFVGFGLGGAIVGALAGSGTGATIAVWIGAFAGALLVAWLAYAFYKVAVYLGLMAMAYTVGAGLGAGMGAAGWVTVAIGVAVAVVALIVALAANLPAILLILATAFSGAQAVASGVMLLTGATEVLDLQVLDAELVGASHSVGWVIGALALGAFGVIVQWRAQRRKSVSHYGVRAVGVPAR